MTIDIDTETDFDEEDEDEEDETMSAEEAYRELESAAESWARGGVRAYQVAGYGPGNGLSGVVIQLVERGAATCSGCGAVIEAVECVDCLDPTTGEASAQYDHGCDCGYSESHPEVTSEWSAYELEAEDFEAAQVIDEMALEMTEEVAKTQAAVRAKLVADHEWAIAALADGKDPEFVLDGDHPEDDGFHCPKGGTCIASSELLTWAWADEYERDEVRTGFEDLPAAARTALLRHEFQDDPEELEAWLAEYPAPA